MAEKALKITLQQLTQDFALKSKDVIDIFKEKTGVEKKSGASFEGVELDVTVNGKDAKLTDNGDGYYVLSIAGIAADKLDDDFAIVVNDQLSFGVNAFDWARLATNNADANVANAARALAAYGVAAGKKF